MRTLWLAIVVVPLLVYPLVTVAHGGPRFPTRSECVVAAVEGQPADVVYGRFDDPVRAEELRGRVLAVGFLGTEVLADGCGLWKVVLEDVPTIEVAREVADNARKQGFDATLELASEG